MKANAELACTAGILSGHSDNVFLVTALDGRQCVSERGGRTRVRSRTAAEAGMPARVCLMWTLP